MATAGGSANRSGSCRSPEEEARVASLILMEKLNLTTEEGEVASFCDDEEDVPGGTSTWSIIDR
jgi:hypothetical protein